MSRSTVKIWILWNHFKCLRALLKAHSRGQVQEDSEESEVLRFLSTQRVHDHSLLENAFPTQPWACDIIVVRRILWLGPLDVTKDCQEFNVLDAASRTIFTYITPEKNTRVHSHRLLRHSLWISPYRKWKNQSNVRSTCHALMSDIHRDSLSHVTNEDKCLEMLKSANVRVYITDRTLTHRWNKRLTSALWGLQISGLGVHCC